MPRSLRVFVGPVEIAGYYSGVARALRQVGVDAVSVDLADHPFGYGADTPKPRLVRVAAWCASRRRTSRRPGARWLVWRGLEGVARMALLAWCLVRFDVFIFGFGTTLVSCRELRLMRLLRKRMIFVFNGSDARPPYIDGVFLTGQHALSIAQTVVLARERKARIATIERYADVIISQPAISHFFTRPVVDFFRVGVPSISVAQGAEEGERHPVIRVLHSPSNPEVKGSAMIRSTVEAARAAGYLVELVELRGVPNRVVLEEILKADFVVDQLFSDAPMVGFATEAAAASRPAVVGGYAWPLHNKLYANGELPPVAQCHPDQLAETMIGLVSDDRRRTQLGRRAREFVTTEWGLEAIGHRYEQVVLGDVPDEWLFDPGELRYVHGVGLPEDRARRIVAGLIAEGGVVALQLTDKPALERAFVAFAAGE